MTTNSIQIPDNPESSQRKRRLAVTGARGFVAGSILAQAEGWDLHAVSREVPVQAPPWVRWHALDSGEGSAVAAFLRENSIDAVIHCAAIANIDYCLAHPDEAVRANIDMTCSWAHACASEGVRLVHVSTDNVFDGARGMYTEAEPSNPVNYYGETKVEAERIVAEASSGFVIARIAIVMGLPVLGQGNSFLPRMVPELAAGRVVGVPNNEIRTPIDVLTVGAALIELAEGGFAGTIHLSGNEVLDRLDLVRRIARRLGYPDALVEATDPAAIPGRAKRPLDVSLDNALARRTLRTPMLDIDPAIDYIMARTPELNRRTGAE